MKESSQIVEFFTGKEIFLTGCTGFLGKLILERLLRICQVQFIYILVRPKKGKSEEERFNEMFDVPQMEPLKKEYPGFLEKIKMIPGDLTLDNLGISDGNWKLLHGQVQIVIHSAATVRFDQHLRTAFKINVRGTRDLLLNARKMVNLQSFLHVSTAYSNCPRSEVLEQIYQPPISARQLEIFLEEFKDDELVTKLTPGLIGEWPNTYSFTKCVAEDMVYNLSSEDSIGVSPLPVSILRPSMIMSTYKNPIPGWIDNFYGPIGVCYAVALGLLRSMYCHRDSPADMVPADYVVSAALASSWATAKRRERGDQTVEVYNYTSYKNSITWRTYMTMCIKFGIDIVPVKCIWVVSMQLHQFEWAYDIHWFFVHTIPAHIVDFFCKLTGRPTLLVDGYKKIRRFVDVCSYFCTRRWSFPHDKIDNLWNTFNQKDKDLFEIRISTFNWNDFIMDFLIGARTYLGKESMDTLPAAKRKYFKLQVANWIIRSLLGLGMVYVIYYLCNLIFYVLK